MPPNSELRSAIFAFRVMGECTLIIAVPVVTLVFAGRWIDAVWGTTPGGMLLGFVVAALFSASTIMKKVKQYDREYKALDKRQE